VAVKIHEQEENAKEQGGRGDRVGGVALGGGIPLKYWWGDRISENALSTR